MAGAQGWWQTDERRGGSQAERLHVDPTFEAILKGSFEHMSEDAKCNFKARLNVLSRVDTPTHLQCTSPRLCFINAFFKFTVRLVCAHLV